MSKRYKRITRKFAMFASPTDVLFEAELEDELDHLNDLGGRLVQIIQQGDELDDKGKRTSTYWAAIIEVDTYEKRRNLS